MSRNTGEISARVEAPVTIKAYLLCAFAAFGGSYTTIPLHRTTLLTTSPD